jgi:hypothetical protein
MISTDFHDWIDWIDWPKNPGASGPGAENHRLGRGVWDPFGETNETIITHQTYPLVN